jgi:hypothetical protein
MKERRWAGGTCGVEKKCTYLGKACVMEKRIRKLCKKSALVNKGNIKKSKKKSGHRIVLDKQKKQEIKTWFT